MNDNAVAVAPKVEITVGGKSLEQIPDSALIEQAFKDSADRLVLRADAIEVIGNDRIYAIAGAVLSDSTKFIKEREESASTECEPYKSAINRIKAANTSLLAPILTAKARLGNLINQFAERKRREQAEVERKQREEVARIQAENQRLEQEKIRLEQEQKRAKEIADQQARQAVTEMERQKAAADAEKERLKLQEQQQALSLQTSQLNLAAVEATKVFAPVGTPGLASQHKWTFKVIGENEAEWNASKLLAANAHPDWFEIKPKVREIEKYAKSNKADSVCPGLTFYEDTKVRPT